MIIAGVYDCRQNWDFFLQKVNFILFIPRVNDFEFVVLDSFGIILSYSKYSSVSGTNTCINTPLKSSFLLTAAYLITFYYQGKV